MLKLGPILHFRGQSGIQLRYAIVLVSDGRTPAVNVEGSPLDPVANFDLPDGLRWWRYDLTVSTGTTARRQTYRVDNNNYAFRVPGTEDTLRVAYASCNGDAREPASAAPRPGRNRLWLDIARTHAAQPFHLMIHGGDQIYADRVWRQLRRQRARYYRDLPQRLLRYYLRRYLWLWSQPAIAEVLASVPAVMSWDDHDIYDGFGSRNPRGVDSDTVSLVFRAARDTCALFQRGEVPDAVSQAMHWHARLGHLGIIALDVRSERTPEQVLSARGFARLGMALKELRDCAHVLVLSSTPMGGFNVAPIERVLAFASPALLVSDIRDQWSSPAHLEEWRHLTDLLFQHVRDTGAHVSVLSGEIHHGAHAILRQGETAIHQYISSGIAHRPIWRPFTRLLDRLTRSGWQHAGTRVLPQPTDAEGHTLIPSENWMGIAVPPKAPPRVSWHSAEASTGHAAPASGIQLSSEANFRA